MLTCNTPYFPNHTLAHSACLQKYHTTPLCSYQRDYGVHTHTHTPTHTQTHHTHPTTHANTHTHPHTKTHTHTPTHTHRHTHLHRVVKRIPGDYKCFSNHHLVKLKHCWLFTCTSNKRDRKSVV